MDAATHEPAEEYEEEEGENDPFDNDAFLFKRLDIFKFLVCQEKTYLCVPEPILDKALCVSIYRLNAVIPL